MRKLLRRAHFYPTQLADVRKALFTTLGANIIIADPTDSGLPEYIPDDSRAAQGQSDTCGAFRRPALAMARRSEDRQHLREGENAVHRQAFAENARLRSNALELAVVWGGLGTLLVSFAILPRAEYLKDKSVVLETRTREMYVAPPGYKLVYFDLSQAELRFAAYLSGDHSFIRACESGDVHTATAQLLFPAEAELIGRDPKGAGSLSATSRRTASSGSATTPNRALYSVSCARRGFRSRCET